MAANLVVGAISSKAGFAMSGFTLLYIVIALWLFLYRRKRLMGGLVEFSTEYAWVQKQLLSEMAMPYAIADSEGHLIWMNSAFGAERGQKLQKEPDGYFSGYYKRNSGRYGGTFQHPFFF